MCHEGDIFVSRVVYVCERCMCDDGGVCVMRVMYVMRVVYV